MIRASHKTEIKYYNFYYKAWKIEKKFYIDYDKISFIEKNALNKLPKLIENLTIGKI